jgi:hypothetical protein
MGMVAAAWAACSSPPARAVAASPASAPTQPTTSTLPAPIPEASFSLSRKVISDSASAGNSFYVPPAIAQVQRMSEAATRFLLSQIDANGRCLEEYPAGNARLGVRTALCARALLWAGIDHHEPALARALDWLAAAKLTGTYAVAMRAEAFAAVRDSSRMAELTTDVMWLVEAAGQEGAYSYLPSHGKPLESYDNEDSAAAVLAVADGAARGVGVDPDYWRQSLRHLAAQQQADGGWPYRIRPNVLQNRTYGSLTAIALAAVYLCRDNLLAGDDRDPATSADKVIDAAMDWLDRNYRIDSNPQKDVHYYYQWLFALSRVGAVSGYRSLGGQAWFAQARTALAAGQNGDGSWGHGDRTADTAWALLCLSNGSRPVLMSKLKYNGRWNARPRDLANLVQYLSNAFERPVSWQIVDIDAPLDELCDAPILYISGAGPSEWSEDDIVKLRAFVYRGGAIISESSSSNADFTLDVQGLWARLFPNYPAATLPGEHPLFHLHFSPAGAGGLAAVSNGVRLLAIHSPRDISTTLQLGPGGTEEPWFELMANAYLYFTDKSPVRPRGSMAWPATPQSAPSRTIRVARIMHEGNCDPEPLAWPRLAAHMRSTLGIDLAVSPPMPPTKLDARTCPIAVMTGTAPFRFSAASTDALMRYLAQGGTVIVDAAGGSDAFASAVESQLLPLLGEAHPLAQAVVMSGPEKVSISYRRELATSLGDLKDQLRLQAVEMNHRPAIIFSREDLTAGLVGYPSYQVRGYSPAAATAIMTNLLCYLSGNGAR